MPNTDNDLYDDTFWNKNWESGNTGWDIGYASPAICSIADQYGGKDHNVLIPGCGNAHEVDYLLQSGFSNITLIDIAREPVERLQVKYGNQPEIKILNQDFFLHEGMYQLILEQTFLCALDPGMRPWYARKMHELLSEEGILAGLLFKIEFEKNGPPFGGSEAEYRKLFDPYFTIIQWEECKDSIPQRKGTELLFALKPKVL